VGILPRDEKAEVRPDGHSLTREDDLCPAGGAEELVGEQRIDSGIEVGANIVDEGSAAGGDAVLEVDQENWYADVEAYQAVAEEGAEPARC
jgi:hypothetical protein